MKNANEPINPILELNGQGLLQDTSYGLTKREYFAVKFAAAYLEGNLACGYAAPPEEEVLREACRYADALLEELERTNKVD